MGFRRSAPSLGDVVLLTSNRQKMAEYHRLGAGLAIELGADLDEVQGPPDAIIVYKAMAAGPGRMVEDSILWVDGVPVVDVKWKIGELLAGSVAPGACLVWEVRLGVLHNGMVYGYTGRTEGILCQQDGPGFGVDPIFWIPAVARSLADLDRCGEKDGHSARNRALQQFLAKSPEFVVDTAGIPEWAGAYQRA